MQSIKGENFIARYDEEKKVLYGIYGAEISSETIALIHMAVSKLIRQIGIEQIRGIIFDFRRVDSFSRDMLAANQRETYSLHRKFPIENMPVALVVDTQMQEQIARMSIAMTPSQNLKQIVFSLAEAHAYFEEWHSEHSAGV